MQQEDGIELKFSSMLEGGSGTDKTKWNVMDRWILSATQSLISWFKQEMAAYRLYTVVPVLVKFIDQLTNWYVRLNRRRLKVCLTLYHVTKKGRFLRISMNFELIRAKPVLKTAIKPWRSFSMYCSH